MAKPSELPDEVGRALSAVPSPKKTRKEYRAARRTEAMTLRMAGLSYDQIGQRLGISADGAAKLVARSVGRAEQMTVEKLRQLENARLDRAQAAIWEGVLKGDLKAQSMFLRISSARSRLNGMNAPIELNVSLTLRAEMESALAQLEEIVLGEIVEDGFDGFDEQLEIGPADG